MRLKRHCDNRQATTYTGRIIGTLIPIILNMAWCLYISIIYGRFDGVFFGSTIILAPIGWFFGRRFDHVKYLSEKDPLTELYNRRYMQDHFAKWINLSDRKRDKLTLLIVDVDDFKTINDVHGHDMGDEVLRHLSKAVVRSIRKKDYVIRWGGDEFVAILPNSSSSRSESALMHQRISKVLSKDLEAFPVHVSVSIGSAVYPDDGIHLKDLLKSADTRLYDHKNDDEG